MGMKQHQNDITGYVNEYGNLRQSEGEGVISGTDRHSGYEQTSVAADSNFDHGAPIHHEEEQQNKIK